MRRFLIIAALISIALTSAQAADKKLTLAAIPKSTGGEFWETVAKGARKAAQDLGVNLKWEGTLTETEIVARTCKRSWKLVGIEGVHRISPLSDLGRVNPSSAL